LPEIGFSLGQRKGDRKKRVAPGCSSLEKGEKRGLFSPKRTTEQILRLRLSSPITRKGEEEITKYSGFDRSSKGKGAILTARGASEKRKESVYWKARHPVRH